MQKLSFSHRKNIAKHANLVGILFFMACSKVEAMAIYRVNLVCVNDIRAGLYSLVSTPLAPLSIR